MNKRGTRSSICTNGGDIKEGVFIVKSRVWGPNDSTYGNRLHDRLVWDTQTRGEWRRGWGPGDFSTLVHCTVTFFSGLLPSLPASVTPSDTCDTTTSLPGSGESSPTDQEWGDTVPRVPRPSGPQISTKEDDLVHDEPKGLWELLSCFSLPPLEVVKQLTPFKSTNSILSFRWDRVS